MKNNKKTQALHFLLVFMFSVFFIIIFIDLEMFEFVAETVVLITALLLMPIYILASWMIRKRISFYYIVLSVMPVLIFTILLVLLGGKTGATFFFILLPLLFIFIYIYPLQKLILSKVLKADDKKTEIVFSIIEWSVFIVLYILAPGLPT